MPCHAALCSVRGPSLSYNLARAGLQLLSKPLDLVDDRPVSCDAEPGMQSVALSANPQLVFLNNEPSIPTTTPCKPVV
jgi:hypothetical protein